MAIFILRINVVIKSDRNKYLYVFRNTKEALIRRLIEHPPVKMTHLY